MTGMKGAQRQVAMELLCVLLSASPMPGRAVPDLLQTPPENVFERVVVAGGAA